MAGEIGVPWQRCSDFIDNNYDYASIKAQILRLGQIARKEGYAIGIGHVGPQGPNTAQALKDALPLLEQEGIELVYASALVEREL